MVALNVADGHVQQNIHYYYYYYYYYYNTNNHTNYNDRQLREATFFVPNALRFERALYSTITSPDRMTKTRLWYVMMSRYAIVTLIQYPVAPPRPAADPARRAPRSAGGGRPCRAERQARRERNAAIAVAVLSLSHIDYYYYTIVQYRLLLLSSLHIIIIITLLQARRERNARHGAHGRFSLPRGCSRFLQTLLTARDILLLWAADIRQHHHLSHHVRSRQGACVCSALLLYAACLYACVQAQAYAYAQVQDTCMYMHAIIHVCAHVQGCACKCDMWMYVCCMRLRPRSCLPA